MGTSRDLPGRPASAGNPTSTYHSSVINRSPLTERRAAAVSNSVSQATPAFLSPPQTPATNIAPNTMADGSNNNNNNSNNNNATAARRPLLPPALKEEVAQLVAFPFLFFCLGMLCYAPFVKNVLDLHWHPYQPCDVCEEQAIEDRSTCVFVSPPSDIGSTSLARLVWHEMISVRSHFAPGSFIYDLWWLIVSCALIISISLLSLFSHSPLGKIVLARLMKERMLSLSLSLIITVALSQEAFIAYSASSYWCKLQCVLRSL